MAVHVPISCFFKHHGLSKGITKFCGQLIRRTQSSGIVSVEPYEKNALEVTTEDLSTVAPFIPNTFNLAAYVNNSETLKKLVDLNVNLNKIEKKPYVVNKILKLDFDRDMKSHILFISDIVGVEEIGDYLTKNPMILCESFQDIEVRINYLKYKAFTNEQIKRIVTVNPFWLMFSTVRIDRRLGYFQKSLNLKGDEVRVLASKRPQLITYNLHHVRTNLFVIKEEMGFEDSEVKSMVLEKPKLLTIDQRHLNQRFNYIHNVMQISHTTIKRQPGILLCRQHKVKQRHLFLQKLGRAQYDPMKENFIPINALVEDTDVEFCKTYAKCNINDFNLFLKTQ